jgi:hypothetical protein
MKPSVEQLAQLACSPRFAAFPPKQAVEHAMQLWQCAAAALSEKPQNVFSAERERIAALFAGATWPMPLEDWLARVVPGRRAQRLQRFQDYLCSNLQGNHGSPKMAKAVLADYHKRPIRGLGEAVGMAESFNRYWQQRLAKKPA